jgi:hypothetical protein
MCGLQTSKLFDDEEQEEHPGPIGTQKILSVVSEAHRPPGSQIAQLHGEGFSGGNPK